MPESFAHGYALLIGVGQSAWPSWSLPVTVKDVRALEAILAHPDLCGYPAAHLRVLTDGQATRSAILDGLGWLQQQAITDPEATMALLQGGKGLATGGWEAVKSQANVPHISVQASGERSVAIGGNVSGSTIITGDRNIVGSGNVVQQGNINLTIHNANPRINTEVRQAIEKTSLPPIDQIENYRTERSEKRGDSSVEEA